MSSRTIHAVALGLALLFLPASAALADQIGGVHIVFEEDYQSARLTEDLLRGRRDSNSRLLA